MNDLRVAAVQLAATAAAAANVAAATAAVTEAAERGARLVVLPEYTLAWAPRLHPGLASGHAELQEALVDAARRTGTWVVAGTLEPHGDRMHNVALAISPERGRVAAYTKVHLFDAFGVTESDALDAGEPGAVVVDVDGWRVGLATCYDLRFPESFRVLVDAGADVLAVGAAWAAGPGKPEQLATLARARALENTSPLVLASQSGRGRSGGSAVIGPLGTTMARAAAAGDRDTEIVVADLRSEELDAARAAVPSLQHRRYRVRPGSPIARGGPPDRS